MVSESCNVYFLVADPRRHGYFNSMEYIPVLMLMGFGLFLGSVIIALSSFLGPKFRNSLKETAFECGVPALGDAKQRYSVRFYLVAILFLLFDVEAIFFFPFALIFRDFLTINAFIVWEMGFFVLVLLLGYFYVLKKGVLEWD